MIWSRAVGVQLDRPESGAQFSLYSLAVEEAKAGAGLLMGHMCLIEDALASGSLVTADDRTCETGRSLLVELPDASRRRAEAEHIAALFSGQAAT